MDLRALRSLMQTINQMCRARNHMKILDTNKLRFQNTFGTLCISSMCSVEQSQSTSDGVVTGYGLDSQVWFLVQAHIYFHNCRLLSLLSSVYKNSVALSPQANYTDWVTATCQWNLVPTFVDRGMSCGQRGRSPYGC
jgi:hypothetical protein